jgi:hypothetical protein
MTEWQLYVCYATQLRGAYDAGPSTYAGNESSRSPLRFISSRRRFEKLPKSEPFDVLVERAKRDHKRIHDALLQADELEKKARRWKL